MKTFSSFFKNIGQINRKSCTCYMFIRFLLIVVAGVAWGCSVKKLFLKILLENTCTGVSPLAKLQHEGLQLY